MLTLIAFGALGRINPRLQMTFAGRPSSYADLELTELILRLEYGRELIGEGQASPGRLRDSTHMSFEVRTSQRMVSYITNSLGQSSSSLQLVARIKGHGRFSLRGVDSGVGRLASDPQPGEWQETTFTSGTESSLTLARSDWYEKIVKPFSGDDFIYLEIETPPIEAPTGEMWRKVVARLQDAERSYALGDDATVFLQLRGAHEALPGYPDGIVSSISNSKKRQAVNELLMKVGAYLHSGRHVSQTGADAGEFPVSHLERDSPSTS